MSRSSGPAETQVPAARSPSLPASPGRRRVPSPGARALCATASPRSSRLPGHRCRISRLQPPFRCFASRGLCHGVLSEKRPDRVPYRTRAGRSHSRGRMKEHAPGGFMNTIADEINDQISSGRKTIRRSLDEMPKISMDQVPRPVLMATGAAVFVAAVGIGWMIYRTRRRRTLVQRLQDALPDSVRDLPDGLRARAKGPLERVVKTL